MRVRSVLEPEPAVVGFTSVVSTVRQFSPVNAVHQQIRVWHVNFVLAVVAAHACLQVRNGRLEWAVARVCTARGQRLTVCLQHRLYEVHQEIERIVDGYGTNRARSAAVVEGHDMSLSGDTREGGGDQRSSREDETSSEHSVRRRKMGQKVS